MKRALFVAVVSCLLSIANNALAVYALPSDRRIAWSTGLDPEGGIPNYTPVTCSSAVGDGTTEAGASIQSCINSASPGTAVYLRDGTYKVSRTLSMKTGISLRGAGPTQTKIKLYSGARISFSGGSKTNWGTPVRITSGYTKGSTSLVLASVSGLAPNDWVSISQKNADTAIGMTAGGCTWCGDDSGTGTYLMQQYAKITAISGNTITISRPMYYTLTSGLQPEVRKQPFNISKAGLEDLGVELTTTTGYMVFGMMARHCWLKNIESYNSGSRSGDAHVRLTFSHGWEIRDSYFHHGHGYGSGQSYGLLAISWNSDHKIENNIYYSIRHVAFEGGGSGCAVLYNYFDANRESEDYTFLNADLNPNHGAHPHMNLIEGNSSAKITWDRTWGSSSHSTAFRNHARGDRSDPPYSWGIWAVDAQANNRYMNIVGNVLGMPTWATGTVLSNGSCPSGGTRTALRFGCTGQPGSYGDPAAATTAIIHGNYDYITDGVAGWADPDHELPSSLYYASVPSWWGTETPWPPIGPDVVGIVADIPAKRRFNGMSGIGKTPVPPSDVNVR